MNRHLIILLTIFSFVFAISQPQAGEIDSHLTDRLRQTSATAKVKVWIKLADDEDASAFKRTVEQAAATRAARHTIALSSLKQKSRNQAPLLAELAQLAVAARAENVKGHWIANVVEAEISADAVETIAARPDVETVFEAPVISLIAPESYGVAPAVQSPQDIEANLTHIKAPTAWGMGYTGAGRLVCSFDTGVYGRHPALASRWKGLDGDSAAAWFDPVYQQKAPHAISSGGSTYWHGTHTMGIMTGYNQGTDRHIGVAYGAKWISAAVIDIAGASILDAFEWAADPDGNPNTVADVPDVINHSWGYGKLACQNVFWDAIDNTEALGIVNVFSAGNSGPTAQSIINPANRAQDSIDCFAVGNLSSWNNTIVLSSSRGGSPCNLLIYKPNVVAPGDSIWSCIPGTGYNWAGGTSQAAPHVSGLVALLRQKNPDATVDEIKTAIINSTQSQFAWGSLPNNTYGWGEIDCVAALAALPTPGTSPSIRVYDFTHIPIEPGEVVNATVVLENLGAAANNVTGTLVASNTAVTVLDGAVSFGTIAEGDTVRSGDYLQVRIADTVSPGTLLPVDFVISGTSPSYVTQGRLYFLVETAVGKAMVTHSGNRIQFTLTNFGVFGLSNTSIFPLGGTGFTFEGGVDELYEGGIIAGVGYGQVSSGVHSLLFDPDMDFAPAPGGYLILSDPGSVAAQQTYSRFSDTRAHNPMGLLVTQESFYYDSPNDDFVTLRYTLKNTSASALSDLYFGLFLDFDIIDYSGDAGGYDATGALTWMAYYNGSTYQQYRGVCLIDGPLGAAGAVGAEVYDQSPPIGFPAGSGLVPEEKYNMITSGLLYGSVNVTAQKDLFLITSAGPLTLAPQATDTVTFALLAAETLPELRTAAEHARAMVTDVDDDPEPGGLLPESFAVQQNYPNPFNPSTVLAFDLPRKQSYKLEVFNTLGQTVYNREGVDGPGRVEIPWDASGLASGAYFYRVTAGEHSQARKMMLIK